MPQLAERADQQQYDQLVELAATQNRTAEEHTQRAVELREEATLRKQLPPAQRTKEAAERAQALRQDIQRHIAEQNRVNELDRHTPGQSYEGPSPEGISL